jgi:hypothetical protein
MRQPPTYVRLIACGKIAHRAWTNSRCWLHRPHRRYNARPPLQDPLALVALILLPPPIFLFQSAQNRLCYNPSMGRCNLEQVSCLYNCRRGRCKGKQGLDNSRTPCPYLSLLHRNGHTSVCHSPNLCICSTNLARKASWAKTHQHSGWSSRKMKDEYLGMLPNGFY